MATIEKIVDVIGQIGIALAITAVGFAVAYYVCWHAFGLWFFHAAGMADGGGPIRDALAFVPALGLGMRFTMRVMSDD